MCTSGALIIDKQQGMTSADVVFKIKKKYCLSSVGHAGTLDPMATGVLVVLVGKATRLQHILMAERKEYEGIICLGVVTDTDDITGRVVKNFPDRVLATDFPKYEAALKAKFLGKMMQTPPAYSAVHVDGKRAYALARANQDVNLSPREVEIYSSDFKFISAEKMRYSVACSKGTYIRSIARDVGEFLGCGASLGEIRRVRSGKFVELNADKLESLAEVVENNKSWLSFDELVGGLRRLVLNQDEVQSLYFGRQDVLGRFDGVVGTRGGEGDGDCETIFNLVDADNNRSIGLAEVHDGKLRVRFML